jgi:Ca-activated chloride channel family protein
MKYCRIFAVLAIAAALSFSGCFTADRPQNLIRRGSFAAGTNVWTRSGLVPIQEVTAGSVVYALNLSTGEWSYQPVLEVLQHTHSGDLITVEAGNERLVVTPDHPFLVAGKPASHKRPHIRTSTSTAWIAAEHLEVGDELVLAENTQGKVQRLRRHSSTETMYDLNVGGDHSFAVTQSGIAVSDATVTISTVADYVPGGGSGGCFPAGTGVWTEDGLVPIETIATGSRVYTCDPLQRCWVLRKVLQVKIHEFAGELLSIRFDDTAMQVTGNHPVWVLSGRDLAKRPAATEVGYTERRETPQRRWLEARSLLPGDRLLGLNDRPIPIVDIDRQSTETTVYNLKVEGLHTYAVGLDGILVHNKGKAEMAAAPTAMEEQAVIQPEEQSLIVPAEGWNTEEYTRIGELPFLSAMNNPLSTLSIDVDTASYSNVRRFLQRGKKPPQDAVRIEEFINYFSYNYPDPDDEVPFSFTVELSDCPWNEEHMLLHLGLQGRRIPFERLPPNNLVFLLDVSGSMNSPGKLPLLKQAMSMLTEQMRSIDRVAIVVYAGAAGLVLPPTSGNEKRTILSALEKLKAGGSTAGGAGIQLAYSVANQYFDPEGNNRVILATDGDFNVGVSSQGGLVRLIEEKRQSGIYLTVLGFGMGNYKDNRMESLADSGNGNYAYIDNEMEARKALVTELGSTLYTIAGDVKIQIEFNPAIVDSYRLIGYENRTLRTEDFADDRKDAGEMGAGHSVTVLYELKMASGARASRRELRYQSSEVREEAGSSNELLLIKFRYKIPGEEQSRYVEKPILFDPLTLDATSDSYRFSAAVAAFALILRDSIYRGTADYELALELAEQALGQDREWYRKEFLGLVKTAQWLDR